MNPVDNRREVLLAKGDNVNVLVFNCGSSSVKFLVADLEVEPTGEWREQRLTRGVVERIGGGLLFSLSARRVSLLPGFANASQPTRKRSIAFSHGSIRSLPPCSPGEGTASKRSGTGSSTAGGISPVRP